MFRKARRHWRLSLIGLLLALNGLVWSAVSAEDRQGRLTVAFLDVGQGDSIFIDSPTGNQVLLDGGPNDQVLRALGQVMPIYDRSLDVVIASHFDQDHIAGLIPVLRRFSAGALVDPGGPAKTATARTLLAEVAKQNLPRLLARRGLRLDLGGGAVLDVLYPDRPLNGLPGNETSLVAKLSYGQTSFFLTGDAPQKVETHLVDLDGPALKSKVLKVGHHGSRTSSAPAFVGAVKPDWAIVSVGARNRYGHPHPEALAALGQAAGQILRTDQLGTIVFTSDGWRVSEE